MGILTKKSKRKDFKLIGVSCPLWVNSYLILYTVAKGATKSDIVRPQIEEWVKEMQNKETEPKLINEISCRIRLKWGAEKCSNIEANWNDFKTNVQEELKLKGISVNLINQIFKDLNGNL